MFRIIPYLRRYKRVISLILATAVFLFLFHTIASTFMPSLLQRQRSESYHHSETANTVINYEHAFADIKRIPYIFVGGFPRSGTTLMRVMLDAHPDVRCGGETNLIPNVLRTRNGWLRSEKEKKRLINAGIDVNLYGDSALGMILHLILHRGPPVKRYCIKDPFVLKHIDFLSSNLPNSKYILMIRDGRAVVHSMIARGVAIIGFNHPTFKSGLKYWNDGVKSMWEPCMEVGISRCLPVWYEHLVLHPKNTTQAIAKFLNLEWKEEMLHHAELVKTGDINVPPSEWSASQVKHPIYTDALSKFVEHIPLDVQRDVYSVAPMLLELGYDISKQPNYANLTKPVEYINRVMAKSRW